MRALAVLLVALNHARVPFLPGGYIGVDVFFVLSGYFITGLLLRDGSVAAGSLGDAGRALARFYARRARRILPAACLVLVVTSVAVYVTYDRLHADYLGTKPTLLDAMSATFFYANIHFAALSTNYFAQSANSFPSPFQHFWSLSVEEQFYVVWPTVLFAAFFAARRLRAGRSVGGRLAGSTERGTITRLVGGALLLICAVSLYLSVSLTNSDALSAYFSTFARAWEFGFGALVALVLPQVGELRPRLRSLLAWLGLAMVIAAAVAFSASTPFPGAAALLPVLGTAMVIVAGAGARPVRATRLLGARPMALIGDRSYSFYLWHFPALIVVWQVAGRYTSVWVNLLLLVGAFAMASLTYTYYENPLRFARWLRGWRTAVMAPASLALTFAAASVPVLSVESALSAQAAASTGLHVAALQPARGHGDPVSLWRPIPVPAVRRAAAAALANAPLPAYTPSVAQLADNYHEALYGMPNSCLPAFGPGRTTKICHLGDLRSHRVVVLFGDSHAQMWGSALVAVAKRLKVQVVPLVKPGCFIYLVNRDIPGWPCKQWYQWAYRQDQRLHPLATVTSFFMGTQHPPHLDVQTREIQGVLAKLRNAVLLADPPNHGTVMPGDCLSAPGATAGTCSTKEPSWYPTMLRELATMAKRTGDPTVPTLQWFCARGVCPMIINHTVTTHDPGHLTPTYSRELGPLLARELGPILNQLQARQRGHLVG